MSTKTTESSLRVKPTVTPKGRQMDGGPAQTALDLIVGRGQRLMSWWGRGLGSDAAVRRHLLMSILSHTSLHPNVSLGPASSCTLGHGDDQEAVEFLTEAQGGTQMAWGFSWRDVIRQ